jgi:negative regulator of flagellin synthesis FlgM
MQIYGPAHVHGPQSVNSPHARRAAAPQSGASTGAPGDRLEISAAAQMASQISEMPDIRHDRVAAIKAAIADGSYETADKLDAALDRLLDEIG